MSWLELVALAGATFFSVFLMGLQSRNVNQGRYLASVVTSFGISVGNFTFARYASTGSLAAFFTSAAGGMAGIAFAIWFYKRFMEKRHGR
ncbi:hypothetical protein N5B55_05065 [Ralstonia pickettii]|uniref:hypothetical protein n=1 Tax=Ralstonia pickettii TaxID=329 RepID=UPI002714C26D|nr:hypothetical protein [Ralstonia pickettii]WKZ86325.1 hypothetical protein N5B55_05065 [Ralstonia pickettii]